MCIPMTPELEMALEKFPLYSQDGKGKEAIVRAVFELLSARWYILEGGKEGAETILFGVAVGLMEEEYGYFTLEELSSIELNITGRVHRELKVEPIKEFKPRPMGSIQVPRVQKLLTRFWP